MKLLISAEKEFPKECESMVTPAHTDEDRHRFIIKFYSLLSDEIRLEIENAARMILMIAEDEKYCGASEFKEILYDYVYSIVGQYYDYKCACLDDRRVFSQYNISF